MLCNALKRNSHFTFGSVIDNWDTQIICIFHGGWIDYRDASPAVLQL